MPHSVGHDCGAQAPGSTAAVVPHNTSLCMLQLICACVRKHCSCAELTALHCTHHQVAQAQGRPPPVGSSPSAIRSITEGKCSCEGATAPVTTPATNNPAAAHVVPTLCKHTGTRTLGRCMARMHFAATAEEVRRYCRSARLQARQHRILQSGRCCTLCTSVCSQAEGWHRKTRHCRSGEPVCCCHPRQGNCTPPLQSGAGQQHPPGAWPDSLGGVHVAAAAVDPAHTVPADGRHDGPLQVRLKPVALLLHNCCPRGFRQDMLSHRERCRD